jgi:glucose/galactose transporter
VLSGQNGLGISSAESYYVLLATFSAFIIWGYPASMVIKKMGYKRTMALSFLLFAVGIYLYIPSAQMRSLPLFLLASFVSGTGNAFLQASVNPYVTILGPIDSAAKRFSIMGICNKLAWPIAPLFLAWIIGKELNLVVFADLNKPFYIIVAIFILLGLIALLAPLPEVKAVGEDESNAADCPYAAKKTSIWQFPHLLLGIFTLFMYVGVETVSLGTLVDYANTMAANGISLLFPVEYYAWVSPIGIVIGYICGILFIPKVISQSTALKICAVLGVGASLCLVLVPGHIAIYCLALLALSCSLVWPAVWPLAMTDLGRFTKTGSSLMVTAIAGGGLFPVLFGYLKDHVGMQNAYWLCLPCFLVILFYALKGYKIRN